MSCNRILWQNWTVNNLNFFICPFQNLYCFIHSGTEEFCDVFGRVDIINSTLGKALGGAAGGYTTGSKELIDLLKQRSRPYLFSNSLPPSVVASGIKVIDMLLESSKYSEKVQQNTKRFRDQMTAAGFTIAGMDHPICPVMLGDARLASNFADKMLGNSHSANKYRSSSDDFVLYSYRERHLRDWIQLSCGAERQGKNSCSDIGSAHQR